MKKLTILIISLFAIIADINAQTCVYYAEPTVEGIPCGDSLPLHSGFYNRTSQTSGTLNNLFSVYFLNVDTGYAVGGDGTIIKTTNAGNNWSLLSSCTPNALFSVYFIDADTGYAAGYDGTIIKTTNAGLSWFSLTSGTLAYLNKVFFTDAATGYIVGDSGKVLKTINAGASWAPLNTGTMENLYSVYFTDSNTAYAVGSNKTIIKTTNAGSTWTVLSGGMGIQLYSVYFTDTNTGYVVGQNSVLLKTIDAGNTWTQLVVTGPSFDMQSVYFTDANTGYAVGWNGKIFKTTDAGMQWWTLLASGTTAILYSAFFPNAQTGYMAGTGGTIIKLSDIDNATLSWIPATGIDDPGIANPKAQPTLNTTYHVTIDPFPATGCGAYVDSVTVLVDHPLQVEAGNDQNINCGDSVQIGIIPSDSLGINLRTYSWAPVSGLNNANIQFPVASPSATTQYTVTLHSNNGCGDYQDVVNVILSPLAAQEICMVSIRNDKNIVIWEKPISSVIDSFFVWRETSISGVYDRIGALAYADSSLFVDTTSNPLIQSNTYQISMKDSCAKESYKSAAHKTMHLAINQGMGTTWNLIWEAYVGFAVSTYKIYRGTTPTNLALIGTTSGSSTQYSDFSAPAGYVYYMIEVVSPTPCNPSKSIITTISNIATNEPGYGVNEIGSLNNIRVYPNPASNILHIENISNNAVMSVYDYCGKVVMNVSAAKTIDISRLAPGVYCLRVTDGKGTGVKRFVKE